jgi:hypothetical protein
MLSLLSALVRHRWLILVVLVLYWTPEVVVNLSEAILQFATRAPPVAFVLAILTARRFVK